MTWSLTGFPTSQQNKLKNIKNRNILTSIFIKKHKNTTTISYKFHLLLLLSVKQISGLKFPVFGCFMAPSPAGEAPPREAGPVDDGSPLQSSERHSCCLWRLSGWISIICNIHLGPNYRQSIPGVKTEDGPPLGSQTVTESSGRWLRCRYIQETARKTKLFSH